jgi:hypothetical protein
MFLAKKLNKGSGSAAPEDKFNYVTMLLHGDGTNGAQNNTFVDGSTNNFTITRNGNTTQGSFSPYGSGWSNVFDGSVSSAYLSVATNTAFNCGTGNFTVEAWVNITAYTGSYPLIIGNNNGGFSAGAIALTSQNATSGGASKISFTAYDINSGGVTLAAASTNTIGGWTHFAVVRNGTSLVLYINGASSASTTISAGVSLDFGKNGLLIGGGNWDTANGYYAGYISNLRLVKGTAVYTSAFTPSTTPLTAITNTSLLTCQSNRFKDNSANNFTITANSPSKVERFNPFGTATAYSTSVIGGSGYFDGTGDYLNTASITIGTGDFTLEAWQYTIPNGSNYGRVFGVGGMFSFSGLGLNLNPSTMRFELVNTNATIINPTQTYSYNSWNHLAVVRSGTTITLYINGVSQGTATNVNAITGPVYTSAIDYLGTIYHGASYTSDIRLTNTAVYTTGFTPPTAPLTAISGTSLLQNMTNGAIFDNAMMNNLETVGALISTSVKKYGTGSIAFDGSNDYLVSNPATTDLYAFGSGNFTIEFWVYINNTTGTQIIYDCRSSGGFEIAPTLYLSSGVLNYYANGTDRITGGSLSISTWYHVALVRSSGSTKLYLNGTQTGSTYTDANTYVNTAGRPFIGGNANSVGNNSLNGYLDDLRVTKGYARYTTTFTPPTAALSDTGPI